MLKENRQTLDRISAFLYKKETITGEEFMKIMEHPDLEPEEAVALPAPVMVPAAE